jgi:CRISPR-associated protein Csd1
MLLSRLVEYAQADPAMTPPFYAPKPVRWIVELSADGSPASERLTPLADPSNRATRNGTVHVVPAVQRSGTGPAPMLGVDTAEYTLGWASDDTRAGKAAQYHLAFTALIDRWHAADSSPAGAAVDRFLHAGGPARLLRPEQLAGNHLVAFRIAGEFAHATASARRFWAEEAALRKGSGRTGLCLVCGRVGPLLQTIPQQLPTRLVPGATNNASLVSLNKPTHGFDLREQLVHTPICATCGLQAMTALEALLGGDASSTLPGQDARLAWWVTQDATFDLGVLDDPTPDRVRELLGSAVTARRPHASDLSMFCALVIGGNVARVVVREWIELPLPRIVEHLQAWFEDHQVADAWTGEPGHIGVRRLATVTGRWLANKDSSGMYARFGAPGADRPEGVYHALLATALLAKPLPPKLLAHLVGRVRTDSRVDSDRAALIRLALRRRPGIPHPEAYMPTLNADNHQPAYLAGRIFAVLEDLQRYAALVRGGEPLNVTFADRYFARAVTSPAVALVAGRKDARAWLKRLRRDRPGAAGRYEQQLDELFSQLDNAGGVPHGAILADQAAFILGYHQQRAASRAEGIARSTGTSDADVPELEGAPQ